MQSNKPSSAICCNADAGHVQKLKAGSLIKMDAGCELHGMSGVVGQDFICHLTCEDKLLR
jgi:hypothetical protein